MFWSEEPREYMRAAVARATVAVGNREEAGVAVGEGEPLEMARRLLELGRGWRSSKLGPRGVLAATADEHWVVPPIPVEVVNGLGAGDAFGGALCHGLLAGWEVERTSASRTRRARSSPRGSAAPTTCRPPRTSRRCL